ncbi:cob(I)yrinic acid a,c-diamide adenosyltransferase [Kallotenue papyrolyticum]|uniref:cob(I)yrinic acid a,c-diamide adenosyltransferase n=1 Tax=Kallotenue papyrolyticum TaxID=1325125 RepID=UPI00047867DF|nr:cob(I)yrinic acid a,c-diamide adenosyltransferase [Kallotenue papyrolyticum]
MLYTRRGDDGYTDLLGGGRVPKEHLRIHALGDIDEATSAIGLGRALARDPETQRTLLHVQKDLYLLMADLATVAGRMAGQPRLTEAAVARLEEIIATVEPRATLPREFVAPGDSVAGAALDVARTVVRRAERTVTHLLHTDEGANRAMVSYLNRLSSLLFALARLEDHAAGAQPTISKAIEE